MDSDLFWLAGLLEGEGSFGVSRNTVSGKVYHYPKIQLGMNDEDVVRRVAALFGSTCKCYPYKNHGNRQPRWVTCVTNSRARGWMQRLRPLMGVRRQGQIDIALRCTLKLPRKLTKQLADEIRRRKRGGLSNTTLAQIFGVSPQSVCNLIKDRTWK